MEVNIPEGLQYQTPAFLASWLAQNNFNCVRLTYSIDMISNPDLMVQQSFENAASTAGTPALANTYTQALAVNPWLSSSTILDAFSEVIDALDAPDVMVILDNHVSKASWCCSETDGNGFWNTGGTDPDTTYFNIDNWVSGLTSMAKFTSGKHNVVDMSLRNELRPESTGSSSLSEWQKYMAQGASAIHGANSNLLVMADGLNYAVKLSWIYSTPFKPGFSNKLVYEFHWYSWSYSTTDCTSLKTLVGDNVGFILTEGESYTGPLRLSEFGIGLSSISASDSGFLSCVVDYMTGNDADWAIWGLQGSYYIRSGVVNSDESYGLLTTDWSGWRNTALTGLLGNMWTQTQGP